MTSSSSSSFVVFDKTSTYSKLTVPIDFQTDGGNSNREKPSFSQDCRRKRFFYLIGLSDGLFSDKANTREPLKVVIYVFKNKNKNKIMITCFN